MPIIVSDTSPLRALEMGLVPIGTLGILVRAKQEKPIVEVQPIMDRLIHDLGFYISHELYDAVLGNSRAISYPA